jgi:hypothetical protein
MAMKGMSPAAQFKHAFGRKNNDPKLTVLWCLLRYVEPRRRAELLQAVHLRKRISALQLLEHLRTAVPIEQLKDAPLQWQDIWVYNYLQYEFKGRFSRSLLLGKYQREVVLKQAAHDVALLAELQQWMMLG